LRASAGSRTKSGEKTAAERHHREFAAAQDKVNAEGGMWADGERLVHLAALQGAEEDNPDLFARLERIALMAEIANHYIDDMRVMPAAGVADTLNEVLEWLEDLHGGIRPRLFTETCKEAVAGNPRVRTNRLTPAP
jgi:hypothetical protein